MSDRAWSRVDIYKCSETKKRRLVRVLGDYGMTPASAWNEPLSLDGPAPWAFCIEEGPLTVYADLGHDLAEADRGAVFEAVTEAKYEWLGGVFRRAPRLGDFIHDAWAGNPVFTAEEVRDIRKLPARQVDKALGDAWVRAFAKTVEAK